MRKFKYCVSPLVKRYPGNLSVVTYMSISVKRVAIEPYVLHLISYWCALYIYVYNTRKPSSLIRQNMSDDHAINRSKLIQLIHQSTLSVLKAPKYVPFQDTTFLFLASIGLCKNTKITWPIFKHCHKRKHVFVKEIKCQIYMIHLLLKKL